MLANYLTKDINGFFYGNLLLSILSIDHKGQVGSFDDVFNVDPGLVCILNVLDDIFFGGRVEDIDDGVLLGDRNDLFVVHLVHLAYLLGTLLVRLGQVVELELACGVDRVGDHLLHLLVGLIDDLLNLLLLLLLSILDRVIFRHIVFNCQFLKPILDLFDDFRRQWFELLIVILTALAALTFRSLIILFNDNEDFLVVFGGLGGLLPGLVEVLLNSAQERQIGTKSMAACKQVETGLIPVAVVLPLVFGVVA